MSFRKIISPGSGSFSRRPIRFRWVSESAIVGAPRSRICFWPFARMQIRPAQPPRREIAFASCGVVRLRDESRGAKAGSDFAAVKKPLTARLAESRKFGKRRLVRPEDDDPP